jgi:magnesium-transporting ATPase (P-type)
MVFLGLVAFIDPIREEAKESIKNCKRAGIKVLMVTGDHPLTAYSIAKDLGIVKSYDEVANGSLIDQELEKGQESFDEFIKTKTVFTRVTPLQKLEIVDALQRNGEFVAVTGDGVNDSPAIKSANIGVAMGGGSDVAKETSNMIIIDNNFMSIVSGVEEGRNAYANIRKVIYMLISCGLCEVLFFILAIMTNLPLPLVAVQLLWLNLVTDGLQDLALSFEKEEHDVMEEKPRDPKESVFDRLLSGEILTAGLFMGAVVFGVWVFLLKKVHMDVNVARGYIMALMVFMQNIHVFNCRSEKKSVFKTNPFSNPFILVAIFGSIGLQLIIMNVPFLSHILKTEPISAQHMLLLFLMALPIIVVMEVFKIARKKKYK